MNLSEFLKENKGEILQILGCGSMLTATLITPHMTKRYLEEEAKGFDTNSEKFKALVKFYAPVATLSVGGAACTLSGCYIQHQQIKDLKSDLVVATTVAATATSMVNDYRKYISDKEGVDRAREVHKQIVEKTNESPKVEAIPYMDNSGIPQHIDQDKIYRCVDSEGMEWYSSLYQLRWNLIKINDLLQKEDYLSMRDIWIEFGVDPEDLWKRKDATERGFCRLDGFIEIDLANLVVVDTDTGEEFFSVDYKTRPVVDYQRSY